MNNQQHTGLSAALVILVEQALIKEDICDTSLWRQISEAMVIAESLASVESESGSSYDDDPDIMPDLEILALSNKIASQLPESAAVLLKHISHRHISLWGIRHQLFTSYENLLESGPISPVLADSLLSFMSQEIESPLRRVSNKHKEMRPLLIKANEAFISAGLVKNTESMGRFIELATKSLSQVDDVARTLTTSVSKIIRSSTRPGEVAAVQQIIDGVIDPTLRLLTACTPGVPIFGPSLEDMLSSMIKLKDAHEELIKSAERPLRGDVVDPWKVSELVLRAFTMNASTLTAEMVMSQQFTTYPFGWSSSANYEKHPVVADLKVLIPWLSQVSADEKLKFSAKRNLVACLANWCGHNARPGEGSTNQRLSTIILDMVFDRSCLKGALDAVNNQGMPILAKYVMNNHRALGRYLPRDVRGEYLSDSLGL